MMAPPARKKGGQKRLDTKSFGDHIVADHTVVKANVEEGVKGETVFLSHKDEVGAVYTDNSRKLIAGYRHQTSTEYVDSSKSLVKGDSTHA